MIIIVTGGRDYNDAPMVDAVLSDLDPTQIWHGGARGADALAAKYAEPWDITVSEFKADWKALGRAAGPIRNQHMIDAVVKAREFVKDKYEERFLVVAFPGGRGTANCVALARADGIDVLEVTDAGFADWSVVNTDRKRGDALSMCRPRWSSRRAACNHAAC